MLFRLAALALLDLTTHVLSSPLLRRRGPGSKVPGKAFDRFVTIFFENVDYDKAAGDPNFQWLYKQGIKLTDYHANFHPSQPNYWAAVGGDWFFWLDDGDHDLSQTTIVDLLEKKGISWGAYQEDMPVVGFPGHEYKNPKNQRNMYVRKHNPLISFTTIRKDQNRLNQIKPLIMFQDELKTDSLPQWMFITPNMTSDGHDTGIETAGQWARQFLEPLMKNKNFMQRTLVLVTWDECESYLKLSNPVLGILLGDAVPASMVGTEDKTGYRLKTVESNWDLGDLGRRDKKATPFANLGL